MGQLLHMCNLLLDHSQHCLLIDCHPEKEPQSPGRTQTQKWNPLYLQHHPFYFLALLLQKSRTELRISTLKGTLECWEKSDLHIHTVWQRSDKRSSSMINLSLAILFHFFSQEFLFRTTHSLPGPKTPRRRNKDTEAAKTGLTLQERRAQNIKKSSSRVAVLGVFNIVIKCCT